MIQFDKKSVKRLEDNFDKIKLLITNKDNSTERKLFKYANDYKTQHIDYATSCVLGDCFHVPCIDDYNVIYDVKCPQNIVDRSIKFCKKYKAEFLFAICGVYGVTVYVKKHNKIKDFDRNKWYRRYSKYFWKKYKIVWTIVEV